MEAQPEMKLSRLLSKGLFAEAQTFALQFCLDVQVSSFCLSSERIYYSFLVEIRVRLRSGFCGPL